MATRVPAAEETLGRKRRSETRAFSRLTSEESDRGGNLPAVFFFPAHSSSIVSGSSRCALRAAAKTIAFFVTLGACLVGLAIALNVTWVVLNWREVVPLVLGIIFFALIIAGIIAEYGFSWSARFTGTNSRTAF